MRLQRHKTALTSLSPELFYGNSTEGRKILGRSVSISLLNWRLKFYVVHVHDISLIKAGLDVGYRLVSRSLGQ